MLFKYILLSIIQGFTEPLPISSSGHLVIIKSLFKGVMNDLNFEIIVNIGSLIAIIIYFKKDIILLFKNSFTYLTKKNDKYHDDFRYLLLLIVGTIPACIIGLLFKDKIEHISNNVKIIGFFLIITAIFLLSIKNIRGSKDDKNISFTDAFLIGLFQCVALLPGISRSASTIVGGMKRDLKINVAFKFSFMLYIPISLATTILGIKDLISVSYDKTILYIICIIISGIVTYIATSFFKHIMERQKLKSFSIYCFIIGLIVLLFL